MGYQYNCIITEDMRYKDVVLVIDGIIQNYTLLDGEQVIDAPPPLMRINAATSGLISPIWSIDRWVEGASVQEVREWERKYPNKGI